MSRNTQRIIDVTPLPSGRYLVTLMLDLDSEESRVRLSFTKSHETEEEARQWAERLDLMLAYGLVQVSRSYQL